MGSETFGGICFEKFPEGLRYCYCHKDQKYNGKTFNHRYKLDWTQNDFTLLGIKFSCNLHRMTEINFKDKITQLEKELKQWSKRILTPFGRITVLKTLIISKLNHLFIALPTPSEVTINKLNKTFFHFIWQSKVDKIKRDILIQEYEDGGLKMIHLNHYICSLKCTWIRRLISSETKYKNIFEFYYTKIDNLINRGKEFARRLITDKTNIFWNEVLDSWIKMCNLTYPTTFEDILSVNIWDNKNVKIANKTIFYKRWYDKHIYFIKDLIKDDGTLMDAQTFCDKYEIRVIVLEYLGVRMAIENFIRTNQIITEMCSPYNIYMPFNIKEIFKSKKGCKDMYRVCNTKSITSKSQQKWNNIFENVNLNWKIIYKLPATSCNNTKLHWFQYRILHRISATNDLLYKPHIKQDDLCSFCGLLTEKIEHLFWHCNVVVEFWESIERWIERWFFKRIQFSLNIDKQTAIFGITFNRHFNKPINYILIITRYYIYKCRINNKRLNLLAWRKEVNQYLSIEKMIAIKKFNS